MGSNDYERVQCSNRMWIVCRSEVDDFDVDSGDEDDHDFTDADAAIDRMLDELQDFQFVSLMLLLFIIVFSSLVLFDLCPVNYSHSENVPFIMLMCHTVSLCSFAMSRCNSLIQQCLLTTALFYTLQIHVNDCLPLICRVYFSTWPY